MWRSYDAFRDGESPCVNVVRCLVLVCPAIGKLRMDVGDEWYVRVNGGAWFGVYLNWNIVKDDGVWCECDGFLGLTSATSAF